MFLATANTRDIHSFQPIGSFQPVGRRAPGLEGVVNVGATRDIVEAAPEYHPDLDFSSAYAEPIPRTRRPLVPPNHTGRRHLPANQLDRLRFVCSFAHGHL